MSRGQDISDQKFNLLTALRLTEKRSGTCKMWECQCECGNITYATAHALKTGHKKSCGCYHKAQIAALGKAKALDLTNKRFGFLTALKDTQQIEDGRHIWECQCDCGKIVYIKSSYLSQGTKTHCGCQSNKSNGEKRIRELLDEYKISYAQEYTFDDLRTNNKRLRFDFYVDNKYLIEFDGKQHYIKDSGYGRELEDIQKRDILKNQYCFDNNIPLIRIPYYRLNELNIKDLLLESSQFVILQNQEE